MDPLNDRMLLHLSRSVRRVVEPSDVYFLEAVQTRTRIRMRGSRPLWDCRLLGELEPLLEAHGFCRIHRNYLVNLRRVREIRRRKTGRDWELKLDPPVNRLLPIGRDRLEAIWAAYQMNSI